jgi:small subunit ribosomal protein S17
MPEKKTDSKKTTAPAKASAPAKAAAAPAQNLEGTRIGTVDSDKRSKSRRVVMSFMSKHPKYGKYIRNRTVLHVHDENNESKLGDVVEIAQCRPMSGTKTWKLVRVVERRAELVAAQESLKAMQQ